MSRLNQDIKSTRFRVPSPKHGSTVGARATVGTSSIVSNYAAEDLNRGIIRECICVLGSARPTLLSSHLTGLLLLDDSVPHAHSSSSRGGPRLWLCISSNTIAIGDCLPAPNSRPATILSRPIKIGRTLRRTIRQFGCDKMTSPSTDVAKIDAIEQRSMSRGDLYRL